jgi:Calcineurin-like phosphoesterase
MAKILLMSDVHIEFGELTVPKQQADVVVLAGDIHVGLPAVAWADRLANELGIPIVLVAGNHEHHGTRRRYGSLGGMIDDLRQRLPKHLAGSRSWSARRQSSPAPDSSGARCGRISSSMVTRQRQWPTPRS